MVERLESHTFDPIRMLQWRNSDLDFASIGALQASLGMTPAVQGLTRAPVGEDILVLEHAARDEEIRKRAAGRAQVSLLWDVCQVPDYRKIAPANHAELVTTLYGFLTQEGKIPTDWFARHVEQADRTEGDIDTLSTRIAHVRTWTFVANRPDWLSDPEHWQGVARSVEDRLSDALHERLTARFVDRRTSVLMRRLRENTALESQISKTGEVTVEGHMVGRIEGFRFAPDPSAGGSEAKALQAAAQKALASEIEQRAQRLSDSGDDKFVLASDGTIRWTGDGVGTLIAGEEIMRPRVRILADEQLSGAARDMVQGRLDKWIAAHIEKLLGPLNALTSAEDVTGIARGVAFQLVESLGVLERQKVADEVKGLDQPARALLRKYGVRFGAYHIYIPALLKPGPRSLATQLYALKHGDADAKALGDVLHLAASGRTSIPVDKQIEKPLYRAAGYRVCGERAVRVDILERLADLIRPALVWREGSTLPKPDGAIDGFGFTVSVAMTSLVGSSGEDFASILRSLGYRMDRRPKPAEAPTPASPAVEVTAPGDEVAQAATSDASTEAPLPVTAADAPPDVPIGEAPALVPTEEAAPAVETATVDAAVPSEVPTDAASQTEKPSQAEPQFIEVWRPGRTEGDRARENRRPRRHQRRDEQSAQSSPTAESGTADAAASGGDQVAARSSREQPAREGGGKHRYRRDKDRGRDRHGKDRGERFQRGKGEQRHEPAREKRERAPDPNSPFAKLAALKAQLEADKNGGH
jgi:ATP-dependent RNA helicase SUPV3L1/SUV3